MLGIIQNIGNFPTMMSKMATILETKMFFGDFVSFIPLCWKKGY